MCTYRRCETRIRQRHPAPKRCATVAAVAEPPVGGLLPPAVGVAAAPPPAMVAVLVVPRGLVADLRFLTLAAAVAVLAEAPPPRPSACGRARASDATAAGDGGCVAGPTRVGVWCALAAAEEDVGNATSATTWPPCHAGHRHFRPGRMSAAAAATAAAASTTPAAARR